MKKRILGLIAVALGGSVLGAGPFAIHDARADCTCRYDGQSYEFGAMVCQRTPQGLRLARCGMVQNNTFWDYLDSPCPTASSTPGTRPQHWHPPYLTTGRARTG